MAQRWCELDERLEGGGRQVDQVVLGARRVAEIALAQQPHFGGQPAGAPVVGRRDAYGAEASAPRGIRPVAPGDEAPLARRLSGRPGPGFHGGCLGRQGRARPGPTPTNPGRRRLQGGRTQEHRAVGRHAQCIRQPGAVQRASQRGVVAKLGVADDRGDRDPARRALGGAGSAPTAIWARRSRSPESAPAFAGRASAKRRADTNAHPAATPESRSTGRPSPRPDNWRSCRARRGPACHPDRRGALLRETRAVQNQHAGPVGDDLAQALPHGLGVPRRVGDEVLERLVGAGIAEPRPHRLHRFARAVAQQAPHVPTQRAALTLTTEAIFEALQPRQQPTQPRGRGVIQHRRAAYRNGEKIVQCPQK